MIFKNVLLSLGMKPPGFVTAVESTEAIVKTVADLMSYADESTLLTLNSVLSDSLSKLRAISKEQTEPSSSQSGSPILS